MSWEQLEKIFNRALMLSFSRKRWLLIFPVLALCGLVAVICRTLSYGASQWIQMSLAFLPMFVCASLVLASGIVLVRVYHDEVKGLEVDYLRTIRGSSKHFVGIAYLAIPLIFAYLILWMVMGVFYLFRAIPTIGPIMSAILSFGPFILVLGSLLLSIATLLMLFYLTPAAALKSQLKPEIAEEILHDLKCNPFLTFVMPVIGLLPILLGVGILSLAAVVTQILYIEAGYGLSVALKWFFIMLPFAAVLTPAVVFFFNFSAESYVLMRKMVREKR